MLKKINYRSNVLLQTMILFVALLNIPLLGQDNNTFTQENKATINEVLQKFRINLSENHLDSAAYFIGQIDLNTIPRNKLNDVVVDLVTLSTKFHLSGETDLTRKYFLRADSVIGIYKLQLPEVESKINYLKGWYCYKTSNMDCARDEFLNTLRECNLIDSDSLKVLVLKYLGNIDFITGNFTEASKYYRESLDLELSRPNPSEVNISGLYQNMGIIHASFSNYDSADYYLRRAIKMKEALLEKEDPNLAKGYLNFSMFLWEIGDLKEALKYINKAENIFRMNYGPDYYDLTPLYLNKGAILYTLNDFREALTYFNLALELNHKFKHPNINEYTLYQNLGSSHSSIGDFEKAIRFNKLALEHNPDEESEIIILNNIAGNYNDNDDDTNSAKKYYLLASEKAESLESHPSKSSATVFLAYGNLLRKTKNFSESLFFLNKALDEYIALYGKKNRKVCESLSNISSYYEVINEYKKALVYAQKSIIAGLKDFNDTSLYHNPELGQLTNDIIVFNALAQKARVFNSYANNFRKDIKDMKATLETSELAITLHEKIKSSLKGEDSKLLLSSKSNNIYDFAVNASTELYELTGEYIYLQKSFEYSEKGKAAVLLSNTREMEALQVGNIPQEIRILESGLKSEIAQYQNIIFEETQNVRPDTNKLSMMRLAMYKRRMVYDSLTGVLEKNYPEYYNLKYNFNVLGIAAIQDKLSNKEAFIEYKLADSVLYCYIITPDTVLIIRKNVGSLFSEDVYQYLSLMNKVPEVTNVKNNSISFAKLGFRIFNNLALDNSILRDKERLIIIPDDVLGYLSFDALVCNSVDSNHSGYNNLEYLIFKFATSYGYSATLYFNGQEKRSGSKNKLLAMAPDYNVTNSGFAKIGDPGIRELTQFLYPLAYTNEEVTNINGIYRGEVLKGIQSSEANFKAICSQFKILHFAMHAVINDEDPLTSKLIFDLNSPDTIEDGFLNTYEIYNLELNAELAVLSACKTGTGKLSKGEGIMSLARGFLYAGVPGIVMTLWAIEDVSSANIITQFYQFLKEGETKDVALRNAKLAYLSNANQLHAHPYFWAAYVQIGDKTPISSNNLTIYYILGLALLLLLIAFYFYTKKRANH